MSIDLVAKGLDFSELGMGYVPAVANGLQYLNFYGVSTSRSARNLVDDSAVDVVGNPVHGPAASLMTPNSNYVRTRTVQAADQTLLVCAKLTDASAILMGTYYGPRTTGDGVINARGMNIWTVAGTAGDNLVNISGVAAVTSGVAGAASANFGPTIADQPIGWAFISFSISSTVKVGLARNHTTGASQSATTGQVIDRNTRPFEVGSSPVASGFGASSEISFAAIYDRVLDPTEKDAVYVSVKRYMASKGIAV